MKSTIITIVATSALTAFLTVAGMAIVIPRMIKIPEMPKFDMAKTAMPDFESIMASQMDGIVGKITEKMPKMPEGITAGGPPPGVVTGPPAGVSTASKDMAANVKKMKQAVKDMEKWAGKMEDSGDEMEVTRDQMALLFNPENSAGLFALMGYIDSGNPAGVCAALCTP